MRLGPFGLPAAFDICDAHPVVGSNAPAVFPLGKTTVTFTVTDASGTSVMQRAATAAKPFGPCVTNYRLDFSPLKKTGRYRISAGGVTSPPIRIRDDAYAGAADTLLYYMREQRSGYNPLFRKLVHLHDGIA